MIAYEPKHAAFVPWYCCARQAILTLSHQVCVVFAKNAGHAGFLRSPWGAANGYNEFMAKTHQQEGSVLEARKSTLAPPPLYTVVLLNDDFTPMDFVVHVLQRFFLMSREQAMQIMLKVHMEGRGVCGIYPRDVATTKVDQVSHFARENQHPLACIMEEN
jgi:ATP-dependent Clp protease adaptor protein ClpS